MSAFPLYYGKGALAASATSISPAWPTGHQSGDIGILAVETGDGDPVLSVPSGFTIIGSVQVSGTVAGNASRTAFYWCRATSGAMTAPTITAGADHIIGTIFGVRGCPASGSPIDAYALAASGASTTSTPTCSTITTSVDGCLVLAIASDGLDSSTPQFTSWANSNLYGFAEQSDEGNTTGHGGLISMACGHKLLAGATGTSTASIAANFVNTLHIALLPDTGTTTVLSSSLQPAAAGRLEGRITVPSGGWVGTIDGTDAFTMPAGTYYWSTADVVGGGSVSFASALQTALNASPSAKTFTVALSLTTGQVTIAGSATFTLQFTSTALRDLCGYSGNLSGAATYLSSYQARNLWLPDCAYNAPNAIGAVWRGNRESDLRENENSAGYGWTFKGQDKVVTWLSWDKVARRKVWQANETNVNESWERFVRDALWGDAVGGTPGGPIRFYPDPTASTYFATYRAFGMQDIQPEQAVDGWAGGPWHVRMPRLVSVPGTETEGD